MTVYFSMPISNSAGAPDSALATAVHGSPPARRLCQPCVCRCSGRLEAERGDLISSVPYLQKEGVCRTLQHAERSVV
jgi:hypothetical protein